MPSFDLEGHIFRILRAFFSPACLVGNGVAALDASRVLHNLLGRRHETRQGSARGLDALGGLLLRRGLHLALVVRDELFGSILHRPKRDPIAAAARGVAVEDLRTGRGLGLRV